MHTVEDILRNKGSQVWTIGPHDTVLEAVKQMAAHEVGALVVTEDDRIVGIISERDYARKIILAGRASSNTRVHEIMSKSVMTATRDWDVEQCMRVMTEKRFRHLPIADHGRLEGMISIGDVVKTIISDQNYVIEQLSRYTQVHIA